jgi:phage-related protein
MAESPTMEVRARLTADSAQFTKGLSEATKSAESFQGAATKLNSALVGLGAVSAGVGISLILFATRSFKAAAEVQELDIALQAIGKSTRYGYAQLALAVEAIKDVGITSASANRAVIKLAQSNVDLGNATQLATVAQNLSVTASVNAADALQTLIFAITTGQTRMLRQIGITTGATEAFAIYGRTIGKSASELNMAERRQAVLNFVLQEGTKVSGAYALAIQSPSKALKEMADVTNNLQVAVGKRLLDSFSKVILASFDLYTKFSVAANGTGTFSKFLDAMEKVLTKLSDPIAKLLTSLTGFIEKIDKSKISVDGIAGTMEKVLPIAAAFATFFGIKSGKSIAQAAPFFQGFFANLARFNVVFTAFVLAVTSPQIRGAIGQLLTAFKPLLPILVKLGAILTEVSALAIGVLAKAIRFVASVVSTSIAIVQKFAGVFKALGVVIAAVAIGYGAYRTVILLTTAATAIWATVTAGTTIVINALRSAVAILNATIALNPIPLFIGVIVALLVALGYLIKTNKSVADAFKTVFNFIVQLVITVFAIIVKAIGYVIKAFGGIIQVLGFFAETFAKVFEFILDIFLTSVQFILKGIKYLIDGFIGFMDSQGVLYDVVRTIFNGIIKVISFAVEGVVRVLAFIIGAIADLVGAMNDLYSGTQKVFLAILNIIGKVGGGIFSILDKIAEGIGKFLGLSFDALTGWVRGLANLLGFIPGVAEKVNGALDKVKAGIVALPSTITNFGGNVFDGIIKGAENTIKGIGGIGLAVEKGLRTTEKTLTKFAVQVEEFGNKDNGAKLIEGLVGGAKKASSALETVINALGKAIKFDFAGTVGNFIDSVANKANAAGDYLLTLSTQMLAFAETTDFADKAGEGISNFIEKIRDSLKEGLGFGDVLKKEREKAEEAGRGGVDEGALADLQGNADLMAKIRDAMKAGIESMRDVLQDLQQAAKDFADSLKDTIMGFAGLKSIELPDGFIPKAKSLIENMQTRLNKSQQFANQITQLQALGLDATAIKDLVESGPIKGAQIAASILGGGAEAIAQINEIQKSIAFTGAAIGKFGSEAAFGQKIASAQAGIAQITDAEASIRGVKGNNIVIEQGAFVVNVDTTGATDQNEKADIITQRIQETFAILAKELANR